MPGIVLGATVRSILGSNARRPRVGLAATVGRTRVEYDGHYPDAALKNVKNQAEKIEHEVENWLGKREKH
jgi:hypothetical protein